MTEAEALVRAGQEIGSGISTLAIAYIVVAMVRLFFFIKMNMADCGVGKESKRRMGGHSKGRIPHRPTLRSAAN